MPGRVAVDGLAAGTMPALEGMGKMDCVETVPNWDEGSDKEGQLRAVGVFEDVCLQIREMQCVSCCC